MDFLGADVPPNELGRFTTERQPDIVAISVVLPEHLDGAREVIGVLDRVVHDVPIMLGGPAVRDVVHARALGAHGFASDAAQALQVARQLADIAPAETVQQVLKDLGVKIQKARQSMNWSQQDLASASGLDRTYISALENGKQNLTISALVRIANALDVPLGAIPTR